MALHTAPYHIAVALVVMIFWSKSYTFAFILPALSDLKILENRVVEPSAIGIFPSNIFAFNITHPDGTDASHKVKVRHQHHQFSASEDTTLEKRDLRAQDQCTTLSITTFIRSKCDRITDLRSFSIRCEGQTTWNGVTGWNTPSTTEWDQCGENEICVDTKQTRHVLLEAAQSMNQEIDVAYCVDTTTIGNMIQAQVVAHQELVGNGDLVAPYEPPVPNPDIAPAAGGVTVEAVLGKEDNETSLFAQSLTITAQASKTLFNTQTWGTVINGEADCTHCASVQLDHLSQLTQRVLVHVVLDTATTAGFLYLATVSWT